MAKEVENKSMEAWIWDAACSIRGAQDATKYKDFILPLIFVKRLCDASVHRCTNKLKLRLAQHQFGECANHKVLINLQTL